jgi:hypothetical protein
MPDGCQSRDVPQKCDAQFREIKESDYTSPKPHFHTYGSKVCDSEVANMGTE